VQIIRVVDYIDAERIMALGISKAYAGSSYWGRETQVEDERRIGILLLLANIGDSKTEDSAILQDAP
jgi:hypothetical protein